MSPPDGVFSVVAVSVVPLPSRGAPLHRIQATAGNTGVVRGSVTYRRINLALFAAGFCTFALLYCVQGILPLLADHFHVGAGESALVLSASTGCMAFSIAIMSVMSERFGRKSLMFWSMLFAALCNLGAALAPSWSILLVMRALEGFALGGVPAVAMAYLAEEIHASDLGFAMGLYVGGNAIGGMSARILVGILAEQYSWHLALVALSVVCLLLAVAFQWLLPASRHFKPQHGMGIVQHGRVFLMHLRAPALLRLFLVGFLIMGVFVSAYNLIGFRLIAAPYHLSATQTGFIFLSYIFGALASPWAGSLGDRYGRYPVLIAGLGLAALGIGLTSMQPLGLVVLGVVFLTVGFFMAHATASGWVGQLAQGFKGHASALYLLAYYLGSSVLSVIGGGCWDIGGWMAVAGFALLLLLIAGLAVRQIRGLVHG